MFILFDSNAWVSQLGLSSTLGSAVRFYAQQHGATLVIPEVVRMEVEHNLTRRLQEATKAIRDSHDRLLSVFGNLKEVVLPSDDQIAAKVSEILAQIDVQTEFLPLTLEAARSSLMKVIDGAPPSDKTEQFRDGVIWAHCVELLAKQDVYLVTGDKAFFAGRSYTAGMAENLEVEASGFGHQLKLFSDVASLLADIRREVLIDTSAIMKAYLQERQVAMKAMLDGEGFVFADDPQIETKLYATENAGRLYLDFNGMIECADARNAGRTDAAIKFSGEGTYDTLSGSMLDLRSRGEELVFTNAEGPQHRHHYVLWPASLISGHKDVKHAVRVPLT